MKKRVFKRVLAILLVATMVFQTNVSELFAMVLKGPESFALSYRELTKADVSAETLRQGNGLVDSNISFYDDEDVVRVMIVLDEAPALTMSKGEDFVLTDEISNYRDVLRMRQMEIIETISKEILKGEELEVFWNLTLVTNAVSTNIKYGFIDEIEALDGVKQVVIEPQFEPMSANAETSNVVSQDMTGALNVKNLSGYTGAGRRVAVIDTGTDVDHQSFDEASYEYALSLLAAQKGMTLAEYKESLNLLTVEKINSVLKDLNCYYMMGGELSAEELYISSKLPFNFNYVDRNYDVTHDNDDQGSHGSHVAGIATANRFINVENLYDYDRDGDCDEKDALALMKYAICDEPIQNYLNSDINGDGKFSAYDIFKLLTYIQKDGAFIPAEDSVAMSGVASDAQLLTMKVFGANGGAYTSDYMAATEDAMVLGCDVANLSLGSPFAGFMGPVETDEINAFVNTVLDLIGKSDMVMATAAGNAGNWADYSHVLFNQVTGMMYADEAGTSTVGYPATFMHALAVASVNNRSTVSLLSTQVSAIGGANATELAHRESYSTHTYTWNTLDKIGKGTTYDVVFMGDPTNYFTGKEQTDMLMYGGTVEDFKDMDFTGKVVMISRGSLYFTDMHKLAQDLGAAAVIIYNNLPASNANGGALYITVDESGATIPCTFIGLEEATAMFEMATMKNGMLTLEMKVREKVVLDIGEGTDYVMSDFSSWGATGTLEIKPEITAPGGFIYSINGEQAETNGYEVMSGTSMATPHISGLVALADQYLDENGILEIARQVSGNNELTMRDLAQSLLMSTAMPMIEYYDEEGVGYEYSVRNQGAGLAQIQNIVNAESFIVVDGADRGKVKAEFGDGTDVWTFTFTVNNITDKAMTYALDASMLTSAMTYATDAFFESLKESGAPDYKRDYYFFALDQMRELGATVEFTGEGVENQSVTVAGKDSVAITVTIDVDEEFAAKMAREGFTNGFYVEGFVYVTPEEGVEHSIPMLGWYGNWSDPSMYDSGDLFDYGYNDFDRPSHIFSPEKNMLTWTPAGAESPYHYTGNVYGGFTAEGYIMGDSRYLEERNAINTSGTGIWSLYAMYPTLIRNAGDIKIEVRNAETGEVYYRQDFGDLDTRMMASFYYNNAGSWYDTTTSNELTLEWDYTDLNGKLVPNGTRVTYSLVCLPEYYIDENGNTNWEAAGKGAELAFDFTIDNTAPGLANVANPFVLTTDKDTSTLTINVQDNEYIAAVILLNGSADTAVQYYYPDMDADKAGTAITAEFDLTKLNYQEKYGNKATIVVCDYAGNESYYSINLNGEGEPYGDFIGFQYDADGYINKWVSFDTDVKMNETGMFGTFEAIVAAEYVNGYIFMQNNRGELHAVPYIDMLANTVDFTTTYVATLDQVYQDLAFDYSTGKLVGMYVDEFQGYATTYINTILMEADEENDLEAYYEEYLTHWDGIYGLTLACTEEGVMYVLANDQNPDALPEEVSDTAKLWRVGLRKIGSMSVFGFSEVADTGLTMDYAQSMTYNHNDGKLYWSRFDVQGLYDLKRELYEVDTATAKCTKVGDLSGETVCLVAPLTAETAAKDAYQNVPNYDRSIVGTPILNKTTVTLGKDVTEQLSCQFDPWYTDHKELIWTSSDEDVVTVEDGFVTGVAEGVATITVQSAADPTLYAQCQVMVAELSLEIEGLISYSGGGLNNISNSMFYNFTMNKGDGKMNIGQYVKPGEDFEGFGLKMATSVEGRGYIWATEHGNNGMLYKIDKETGIIVDMLSPVDGDMMFGLAYSEATDMFTGIMNFYMYVDLPFTLESEEDMKQSWDDEKKQFTWHRVDMRKYLEASQGNFVTSEDGASEIVFCGITSIDYTDYAVQKQTVMKDYLGNMQYLEYTPDATFALLDNVGRLWYIDEMTGWILEDDIYMNPVTGEYIPANSEGVFAIDYDTENGKEYSVFVIRHIEKTPLTDKHIAGELGITYHFSSIHFAGWNETSDPEVKSPMYVISAYNYWHEAATNELYLCVDGESMNGLYSLGNTGFGYLVATITSVKIIGGVNMMD